MKELFTKYFKEASSYQSIDPTCFDLQEFTETWLINNKEAINFTDSSLQLKENHIPAFVEWYLNNGYMHTERPNVYKNGLNIILRDDLYSKYLQEIKVNL